MLKLDRLDKPTLRAEFAKSPEEYYKVELFEREGFTRKKCRICGINFWSVEDRDVCEDSSHTEYTFFKEKPRDIGYVEFWKKFSDFFKKNGHTEVPKYPVVSRWRRDLYFTIASIQDFQRIEGGKMSFEYSANPLIVPQMCLRFSDIENVGVTGRHFTGFMMAGQHAFNYPKEGYWKDRTIELNFEFLTKVIGIKKENVIYSEDAWAMPDFSEFGPDLESFANGAELVNSVFTQFEYVNGGIRELNGKVVDVGWGFERLLWFYTGYDDAYEAVFHGVLEKLRKRGLSLETDSFRKFSRFAGELDVDEIRNAREKERQLLARAGISKAEYEKKVKPVQALYAILDHTRTLMFAISDGALPSNIGGGYNLRIILRRAFDFIDKFGFDISIPELAREMAEELQGVYPELSETFDFDEFDRIIKVERQRHNRSRENARQVVSNLINKRSNIDAQQFRTLYESNGITPEFLLNEATARGIELKLPENVYGNIIEGDLAKREKKKKEGPAVPDDVQETKQLYYDFKTESESRVLFSSGRYVVLDQTPFYPEGGGQAADRGKINGVIVTDVQKHGGVIVHTLDRSVDNESEFRVGASVYAEVDKDARMRLTAHHTATHLISAAARNVLGRHAWQEGTRKEPEKAHIDVAHYDKLSEKELGSIESMVNGWIFNGISVNAEYEPRGEAEMKYGFEIYQGHGVPSKTMRIVTVHDRSGKLLDAQACGGLHAIGRESILGIVKIINSYRSHDGIVRIEFVAGPAALEYFGREDMELHEASRQLNAELFGVSVKINDTLREKENMHEELKRSVELVVNEIAENAGSGKEITRVVDFDRDIMRRIADRMVSDDKSRLVILENRRGDVLCIAGDDSGKSAVDELRNRAGNRRFVGGGSKKYAEGKMQQ